MNVMRTALSMMVLSLVACSTPPLFPPAVLEGVEKNFDFKAWQTSPSAYANRKVQLGGMIQDAQPTDEGVLIVTKQLPIVEHPAYGPSGSQRRPGSFEFAFLYRGKMPAPALEPGNRLIVVGTTQGAKAVTVGGATRTAPFLMAQCVHIWNTGGREIADFESSGAGYQPLAEETYCSRETAQSPR